MLGREVGELGWVVGFVEVDGPATVDKVAGGDEDVAGVVALAAEGGRVGGLWKKLGDDVGDGEAGLVHEGPGADAAGESGFFDGAHLVGGNEHGLQGNEVRTLP